MKSLGSVLSTTQLDSGNPQNTRLVVVYLVFLLGLITFYSLASHALMALEGQSHSWLTGFYWTLVVMSTLGFGDITFQSDLGRAFSILVLLSGIVSLLVAVGHGHHMAMDPDPDAPLAADTTMVIVGSVESERRFLGRYAGARANA